MRFFAKTDLVVVDNERVFAHPALGGVDVANGNSTADSPATSRWLPRVWVGGFDGAGRLDAVAVSEDGSNPGAISFVVWFRRTDGVEVAAADTVLAALLQCEARVCWTPGHAGPLGRTVGERAVVKEAEYAAADGAKP